jgi:hypothetical protein
MPRVTWQRLLPRIARMRRWASVANQHAFKDPSQWAASRSLQGLKRRITSTGSATNEPGWLFSVLCGTTKLFPNPLTNPLLRRMYARVASGKKMTKGRRWLNRILRSGKKAASTTSMALCLMSAPFLSMGHQATSASLHLEPANYCASDPFDSTSDRAGVSIDTFEESVCGGVKRLPAFVGVSTPPSSKRPNTRRNSGISILQLLKPLSTSSAGLSRHSRSLSNSLTSLLSKSPTTEQDLSSVENSFSSSTISNLLLASSSHAPRTQHDSKEAMLEARGVKTQKQTRRRINSARQQRPPLAPTHSNTTHMHKKLRELDKFSLELEGKLRPGMYQIFSECVDKDTGRFVVDKKTYSALLGVVAKYKAEGATDVYVWKLLNQYLCSPVSVLILSVRIQGMELLDSHLLALSCSSKAFRKIRAIQFCNTYLGLTQDARGLDAMLLSLAKSERLETVTMIRNSLADTHAPMLARFVKHCHTLTKLSLCWNAFTDSSIQAFGAFLARRRKHAPTRHFDLSCNQFSVDGKRKLQHLADRAQDTALLRV